MPRRRIAKGRESGSKSKSKSFHKSDGKLKKWNTISDIPMDEEDQFHASKDKILLEGDRNGDYGDDSDDDEVFALKGIDDDSEEGEDGSYAYEDDEILDDEAEKEKGAPATKKKSKHSRKVKGKTAESPEPEEEEEEEEEGWGRGRAAYYSSNADQLESDDEEGNELEEQEAKRLQAAARKEMTDDDFGLNDNPEVMQKDSDMDGIAESTPSVLPTLPTDKKGLLRHLEKTSPETLALARDWDETARNLHKTQERISKIEAEDPDAIHLGMVHLHYQALLSYSTMLAFYLHLRSSAKYAQRPSLLQSHPILQRLLTLKQSLATLEDLDFAGSDSEDNEDDGSITMDEILADGEQVWRFDDAKGLESNELAELLEDATSAKKIEKRTRTPPKKKRKTTTQDHPQPVGPIFDLVEPQFVSSKSSSSHEPLANDADAYGEMTALHFADLADKSVRKKSLRFHTSKIDSASARRQGARNQVAGGDDDLPYRQRKKEKDAQLVKEAVKKLNNQGGDDLDDEDPEPPRVGEKRSRQDEDDADDPDGYYELVKKKSKENKEKKKAEYEETNGRVRFDLEEDKDGGPRSLTRAILKNRGLTPHRPKSVRNPRVKKRMRFEKAKKTVSSQKAIYKGGLSQSGGRYEGEKSGISKVVKSVRLG